MIKMKIRHIFWVGWALALLLLAACGAKAAPTPKPPPTTSPAYGTTPTTGMSANWQAYGKVLKSIHLWKVPADRPPTAEDMAKAIEVFTFGDAKIGIFIEADSDFRPGWKLTYRLDKRGPDPESQKGSLASLVTGPGVYYTTVDRPKDAGGYVFRFWLEDVLIANVTFEVQ